MPVQTVIKLRRDTAANWDATNPVLAAGEMGIETDTSLHKFGDGTTAWGALQYSSSSRITQQVKNTTGSLVPKGSVVYISGATGGEALIALADADSEATSSKVIGLTTTAISNDALGMVIEQGLLVGVNTASATAGQSVWLSSTAGQFVFGAPPAKPAHSVYLGVVVRVHATEGEILVKVQNGYELNELHDVNAGSPSTGQVLQWNGSMWVNASVDALPSQSGQNGKYLTTDGTTASWGTITIPPGTTVSDTAPSSPSVGQLWWESDTGILYIYYDGFWVEATAGIVGPAGTSGAVQSATAPIDTSVLWIDTTENGEMVVPAGGTAGQALVKATSTNYDTTWAGPYATSPNYIINGAFDINQRGFTSTSSNVIYMYDRFRSVLSGGTVVYTANAFSPGEFTADESIGNYLKVEVSGQSASGDLARVDQVIESVETLSGKTATISFWAKAASGSPSIAAGYQQAFGTGGSPSATVNGAFGKGTLSTSWQRFSFTTTIPSISGKTLGTSNSDSLIINIFFSAGSDFDSRTGSMGTQANTFDITGVQLEAGSVATPFRRNANSLQGELAACARYFERIELGRVNTATSGNSTVMSLPYMTRKRSTPSVSTNATNANYGSVWTFSQSGVSTSSKSGTVTINFDGSNSGINHLQINAVGATYSPTPNTLESLSALYFDISSEL